MPEGPSLVHLKQQCKPFKHQKIVKASGYAKLPFAQFKGKTITDFKTHGKAFFVIIKDAPMIRIHLMLLGHYLLNDRKEGKNPVLRLELERGELNFYMSNIKALDGGFADHVSPGSDIMSKKWDAKTALLHMREKGDQLIADVLLDQQIFSGVGNKIKNEALWAEKVHPESPVSAIPDAKLKALIRFIPPFAGLFLDWIEHPDKQAEWHVHDVKTCKRDGADIEKKKVGKTKRMAHFCPDCQKKYGN